MSSAKELLATQIANELGAAEMLQGPYLDAVPVIARSLTTHSLALNITGSSAKELEQTLARAGSAKERAEFIAEHDLALTAAVRREDAAHIETSHPSPGTTRLANLIRTLIKPEEQSALDAYVAEAVEKRIRSRIRAEAEWWASRVNVRGTMYKDERERLESALKGSSDAVPEREEPKL